MVPVEQKGNGYFSACPCEIYSVICVHEVQNKSAVCEWTNTCKTASAKGSEHVWGVCLKLKVFVSALISNTSMLVLQKVETYMQSYAVTCYTGAMSRAVVELFPWTWVEVSCTQTYLFFAFKGKTLAVAWITETSAFSENIHKSLRINE